jgi:ABC-type polysaccharide/polyol phosphate export permease
LNPLAGIIESYRASLFALPFDWAALAVSAFSTLAILLIASYMFRRMEKVFAEFV